MSHELLNDLRFRVLGNLEIFSHLCGELLPSLHFSQHFRNKLLAVAVTSPKY